MPKRSSKTSLDPFNYSFASDNTSGLCDESLQAIIHANASCVPSYGNDDFTAQAADAFRQLFQTPCQVFFVFNGTAANSLALSSLCQSYHSIITPATAHIETDECGAPEFFSNGVKLLTAATKQGRLPATEIPRLVTSRSDIHYPKPRVVTLSQSTELGTVYTPAQLKAISQQAKRHHLLVHMDGARFANAVASTGASPADLTWKSGVDVLCFGGTKNGIGLCEAVIFFDTKLAYEFDYRCKQAGQLASKMRFLAAPWAAALRSHSWLTNAQHANASATLLARLVKKLPHVQLLYPVQSNAVFLNLPEPAHHRLAQAHWKYYRFIGGGGRFMCSHRTTSEEVHALADAIAQAVRKS